MSPGLLNLFPEQPSSPSIRPLPTDSATSAPRGEKNQPRTPSSPRLTGDIRDLFTLDPPKDLSQNSKSETPSPRDLLDTPDHEIYRQYYNVTPASSPGSFMNSLNPDEDPSVYDIAHHGHPLSSLPWFNELTPPATSPQSIQLFETDSHSPSLTIPSTVVHHDLVAKLVKEAAYMGYRKGTQKSAEDNQKRKKDDFERAYRAGVASVITLYGNNQGLDESMVDVLNSIAYPDKKKKPELPTTLWKPPKFTDAWQYQADLQTPDLYAFLGRLAGESLYFSVVGYVLCQGQGEDDLVKNCEMVYQGHVKKGCFVFGSIGGSAVMVDEDENVLIHYPSNALDPPHPIFGRDTVILDWTGDDIHVRDTYKSGELMVTTVDYSSDEGD